MSLFDRNGIVPPFWPSKHSTNKRLIESDLESGLNEGRLHSFRARVSGNGKCLEENVLIAGNGGQLKAESLGTCRGEVK